MNWNDRFELAKAYYEHHGDLRVVIGFKTNDGYTYDENGFELGIWISRQRHQYKIGETTPEHYKKLMSIGMIYDDLNILDWENFFNLAIIYLEHYGELPVSKRFRTIDGYTYDEKGKNLGAWFNIQRLNYSHKKLSEERAQKIETLFKMFYKKKEEERVRAEIEWEEMYELAFAYYGHYEHLNVPIKFTTSNGYEYDEDGLQLGKWLRKQRRLYKRGALTEQQVKKLKEIKLVFADFVSAEWKRMYNLAKTYYEHHGNLKVPRQFNTKNGYEYDKDGSKLGKWVNTQYCRNLDGYISKEEYEKLLAIGMVFENQKGTYWNKMYELAQAYYEHHKNLAVLTSFKTTNGYAFDEEGKPLGVWLNAQRKCYLDGKLSQEHAEKLKAIGMVFENLNDAKWEKMYALAKTYYEHYKNLLVDLSFKTTNGYTYDEDGFKLGSWVYRQKLDCKSGKIYVDREEKLKVIGMTSEGLQDIEWDRKYALAVAYYQHYHKLNIDCSFKTTNGYTYDEEGDNLGKWIGAQRTAYKNKKLSQERIDKLKMIGMIFEVRNDKKQNQDVCINYGINYAKHKKEIDAIPHKEFISKINYLDSQGIQITLDDKLHPIFFMSSVNMEARYGISLEQLIAEYQPTIKKVKRG